MRELQTVLRNGPNPNTWRRSVSYLRNMAQFSLLFAACLFLQSVSAETGQTVPEITADNAIIGSPQTTLSSLIRLTDVYHELVSETGITSENQERLKNISQQFEKLFNLREVPPKFRRNVAAADGESTGAGWSADAAVHAGISHQYRKIADTT